MFSIDSVTKIGKLAFRYYTSLSSVVIPDSVTKMGDGTFDHTCKVIRSKR